MSTIKIAFRIKKRMLARNDRRFLVGLRNLFYSTEDIFLVSIVDTENKSHDQLRSDGITDIHTVASDQPAAATPISNAASYGFPDITFLRLLRSNCGPKNGK